MMMTTSFACAANDAVDPKMAVPATAKLSREARILFVMLVSFALSMCVSALPV